jgi:hypothetical protein
MTKSGTVKSVFLTAFIGIVLIALVMPIAGQNMGQGKMMEQKDMMVSYPDNSSMMQSSMTTQNANLSNINID